MPDDKEPLLLEAMQEVDKLTPGSKPITPKHKLQKHLDLIARIDRRVHRKANRILDAEMLAATINDDGSPVNPFQAVDPTGKPAGWTWLEWRVARDARLPEKRRPSYLNDARRITESYIRGKDHERTAPVINAAVQVVITDGAAAEYFYPERDLTDIDK